MDNNVPTELRTASEWGWRLLVLVAVGSLLVLVLVRLEVISVALFVGLGLAALLAPVRSLLRRFLPPVLATGGAVGLLLLTVGGLGTFVGTRVASDWGRLRSQVGAGIDDVRTWLQEGPLHASETQIDAWFARVGDTLVENRDALTSGALSTASTTLEILTGVVLALIAATFFLHDGRTIWNWVSSLVPGRGDGDGVEAAGVAAWKALTGYVRGTVIIALADSVLIGIALVVLGVPLAGPLTVLVFLGAFVPIVGAFVAGFVAVAVALATNGLVGALVVLVVIVVIQQLEGHILQPLVMNKAVSIHPLGVILAVAAGTLLAGVVGAVVAVPVVAALNAAVRAYKLVSQRGAQTREAVEAVAEEEAPEVASEPASSSDGSSLEEVEHHWSPRASVVVLVPVPIPLGLVRRWRGGARRRDRE